MSDKKLVVVSHAALSLTDASRFLEHNSVGAISFFVGEEDICFALIMKGTTRDHFEGEFVQSTRMSSRMISMLRIFI